jgi:penicillin-binding protein 1C
VSLATSTRFATANVTRDVVLHLHEKQPARWFARPAAILHARIDPRTGKRLTPLTPPARVSREELEQAKRRRGC